MRNGIRNLRASIPTRNSTSRLSRSRQPRFRLRCIRRSWTSSALIPLRRSRRRRIFISAAIKSTRSIVIVIGKAGLLSSQFSYKRFDADITAQSNDPYRLLLETTEGGFFNRQARRTSRTSWQENYQFAPWQFAGSHQFTVGLELRALRISMAARRSCRLRLMVFRTQPVERISFTSPTSFHIDQNETAWFAGDQWAINPRLTLSFGVRFDNDTITNSTHAAPRAGFLLALTEGRKDVAEGWRWPVL